MNWTTRQQNTQKSGKAMTRKIEYIRYLNLPPIPEYFLFEFEDNSNLFPEQDTLFIKTGDHCENINKWCQENICDSMFFGVLMMQNDLPIHKDTPAFPINNVWYVPDSKITYLADAGGEEVYTRFWDEEGNLLKEYLIEPRRWHLIQVNVPHSVEGVQPPRKRWSVTTQLFHQEYLDDV